jgi:hypothetical protein
MDYQGESTMEGTPYPSMMRSLPIHDVWAGFAQDSQAPVNIAEAGTLVDMPDGNGVVLMTIQRNSGPLLMQLWI